MVARPRVTCQEGTHVHVQVGRRRSRHRERPSARRSGSPGAAPSGLGAQHVVAMFGATFVFPLVMGLDPNLAIMFSGICTILFLLICRTGSPATSAPAPRSWPASPRSARQGGDSADVTGAIMVAGLVLALVGVLVHFGGSQLIHRILPPAVTGAVVMLIGFNLAPVVAGIYWPQDQWIALPTAGVHGLSRRCCCPGFWSRIAVFLALIFGYLISFARRQGLRPDHLGARRRRPRPTEHDRVSWAGVKARGLDRLPLRHAGRRRLRRARPELLADVHPARPARVSSR